MSIDRKFYTDAFNVLEKRRQAEMQAANDKKAKLYIKHPELESIEKQLASSAVAAARCAISGDKSGIEATAKLNLDLQKRRKEIMNESGISYDDLLPKYECSLCNDTGYQKDGKLCICVKKLARKLAYDDLNSSTPLDKCTFGSFDINLYPEENRMTMQKIFDYCKDYANNFNKNSESLMFMGATGLGKTHLSLAIAGIATEKGAGVIYAPLRNILSRIENEHFSQNSNTTLENVCNCDLLIIDDLGTEFSSQFTKSVIFEIINTRLLNSKPVIISTNLDVRELEKMYTERVVSRIVGCYRCFEFVGRDIRLQG